MQFDPVAGREWMLSWDANILQSLQFLDPTFDLTMENSIGYEWIPVLTSLPSFSKQNFDTDQKRRDKTQRVLQL